MKIQRNPSTLLVWISHIVGVWGTFYLTICGGFSSCVLLHHSLVLWYIVLAFGQRSYRMAVETVGYYYSMFFPLLFCATALSNSKVFNSSDFCCLNSVKYPFLFWLGTFCLSFLLFTIYYIPLLKKKSQLITFPSFGFGLITVHHFRFSQFVLVLVFASFSTLTKWKHLQIFFYSLFFSSCLRWWSCLFTT